MFNTEQLEEKWDAVLNHDSVAPIQDKVRRSVVARLLENQETALKEQRGIESSYLVEDGTTTGNVQNYDPVLISLVRRAMPNIIAYDVAGVQPLTQPTGLIFAMKSLYKAPGVGVSDVEALHDAPDTAFSGNVTTGENYTTAQAEALKGSRSGPADAAGFGEMGFEIVKSSVEAQSRALRATYTTELAQDLKAVHGLDAESELANILSTEILSEINREILLGINTAAKTGAANATAAGTYDLAVDADGRWSVEKFKALIFQLEMEANQIALDTRRGKGNLLIASSNVVSALSAAGTLDHTPALGKLEVDPTGNLFAGVLNGQMKVFVDPFAASDYATVGYRGSNVYDAGVFYCPYVPLTMMRAVGEDDFQPRIGFKTRYGVRANPFVKNTAGNMHEDGAGDRFGGDNNNQYFRTFAVTNIGAS